MLQGETWGKFVNYANSNGCDKSEVFLSFLTLAVTVTNINEATHCTLSTTDSFGNSLLVVIIDFPCRQISDSYWKLKPFSPRSTFSLNLRGTVLVVT